ncbi:myb-related transcription factor, partner of profilin-like [Haliotis rufescens]|uniref:myb-related transcription factor, partner of profilin-like n=1 Tax=Haliotis rufescens TaxID=6454 RepID=UPI00201F8B36|nr:myb-related transcription factor, partner of profilin-like [Haliotis rufescens]
MTEDAKKRRPNFTKEESLLLAELVASNKLVIEGKFGPGITSLKRQEAWQMITDTLNASLMHRRTKEEVEKKWKNLKSQSKKAFSNFRQQTIATGKHTYGYISLVIK